MRKILLIGLCALATNFASAESSVNKESTPAIPKSEVTEFVINESVKATTTLINTPTTILGTVTINCVDGYTTTITMNFTGLTTKEILKRIDSKAESICSSHGGCLSAFYQRSNQLTPDPIIRP